MNLRTVFFTILLFGIGILGFSLTQNTYKNEAEGQELINQSYKLSSSEYDTRDAELRTSKNQFMDFGSGITVFSASILCFLFLKKIKNTSDLKELKSLSKKGIFIWANLFWLLLIPGTHLYYWFRALRGDYPANADSFGIPIMTQTPVIWYGLIPLNLFLAVALIKSKSPSTIFSKFNFKSVRSSLWEIVFIILVIFNQVILATLIVDGDHFMIITNLVFTYIFLSLRSGQNKEFHAVSI